MAHKFLLDNIDNLDLFRVANSEISGIRFSINSISWFGVDMKYLNFTIFDDEQQLSCDIPRILGLKNCIMGNVLCAHYAFGP